MSSGDKMFAAELRGDAPELDLHGTYPSEAEGNIDIFLYRNINESSVKIIFGFGTGVLRERVIEILNRHPLVVEYKEIDGYCIVLLW